ncbi:MAG: hypothetical protein ACOX3K_03985 [Bacilli bacterium]
MTNKYLLLSSSLTFVLTIVSLSFISEQNEILTRAANGDNIEMVLSPRYNQNEGNVRTESTFSAIHMVFEGGNTNQRAMVYANCTKSGTEYYDISGYKNNGRFEVLLLDGTTTEHMNPFLVDKDGRTYIFGTTNATSMAGSAYYETQLDLKNPANNKNINGWYPNNTVQLNYNYHGIPVNCAAHGASTTHPEFAYYHLNLASHYYQKNYTEWAEGLNLDPADTGFDFANVKLAGFYLNKQCLEEQNSKWDFKVLTFSVRNTTTGERLVLFDARQAVMTSSNTDLWNNRIDEQGNSYVYTYINPGIANNVTTEIGHDFTAMTISQGRPLTSLNNGVFRIEKGSNYGYAWLWAFAKNQERFTTMDLTGFDGTAWHIDNQTGGELRFDWYYVVSGTNYIQNKYFLFPDNGDDAGITNPVTSVIPAGFKGWVYSLFEQNASFQSKLTNVANEPRFVLAINEHNIGKTFVLDAFKIIKNGQSLVAKKHSAANSLGEIDNSAFSGEAKSTLDTLLINAKKAIFQSENPNEIDTLLSNALNSITTKRVEETIALINAIGIVAYDETSRLKIEQARAAYNSLTEVEKIEIADLDYKKLTDAEEEYQRLYDENTLATRVANVKTLIADIGEVTLSEESRLKILAAREAYDDLPESGKAMIEANELQTLIAAESEYERLLNDFIATSEAQPVIDLIADIGEVTLSTASKEKIETARAAYEELSEEAKAKVQEVNYQVLLEAEARYDQLEQAYLEEATAQADAYGVIIKIRSIGYVRFDEESRLKIEAARTAYDHLSVLAKSKVPADDYQILTDAEARYAYLRDHPELEEGAKNNNLLLVLGGTIGGLLVAAGGIFAFIIFKKKRDQRS